MYVGMNEYKPLYNKLIKKNPNRTKVTNDE